MDTFRGACRAAYLIRGIVGARLSSHLMPLHKHWPRPQRACNLLELLVLALADLVALSSEAVEDIALERARACLPIVHMHMLQHINIFTLWI